MTIGISTNTAATRVAAASTTPADPTIDPNTGVPRTNADESDNFFGGLQTNVEDQLYDVSHFTLGVTNESGSLAPNPVAVGAATIGTVGAVGTTGLIRATKAAQLSAPTLQGIEKFGIVATSGGKGIMIGGLLVTPYLGSAILGPAAADVASYIKPDKVPKFKKLTEISALEERKKAEVDNKKVPGKRFQVGGAVTGVLGLGLYAFRPQYFKKTLGLIPFVRDVSAARLGANAITKLGDAADIQSAAGKISASQASWDASGWLKKGLKIAGTIGTVGSLTAVPGATAASKYFSIRDDYDTITGARSEWRK